MKTFGGYLELELHKGEEFHKNAVKLNSARNCLRYLIRMCNIKELWVPRFTCPVVWDAVESEHCKIKFYSITEDLMPEEHIESDEYILYTNYFGICWGNISNLQKKYTHLLVDNAQGFFAPNAGIASFYSPRKFFGVPDGGYLTGPWDASDLPLDQSYMRFNHLLKRIESGAQAAYADFQRNEEVLDNQPPKRMSHLTQRILESVNYPDCIKHRRENYGILHDSLKDINNFKADIITDLDVPMVYPFLLSGNAVKHKLIEHGIFVATYWPGQKDQGYGAELEEFLVPLPIDQRYSRNDMIYIAQKVLALI